MAQANKGHRVILARPGAAKPAWSGFLTRCVPGGAATACRPWGVASPSGSVRAPRASTGVQAIERSRMSARRRCCAPPCPVETSFQWRMQTAWRRGALLRCSTGSPCRIPLACYRGLVGIDICNRFASQGAPGPVVVQSVLAEHEDLDGRFRSFTSPLASTVAADLCASTWLSLDEETRPLPG